MKPVVLFVDDEPNILSGIRRALLPERKIVDFIFAESGQEAIDILDQTPVDIVVSDMRMPEINGVAVLRAAAKKAPWSLRVILSGYADKEALLKAAPVSHQYLSKPCSRDALSDMLNRAVKAINQVPDREERTPVAMLQHLPAPSHRCRSFEDFIETPNALKGLANCITEDTALAVKSLQLTNSAYFSRDSIVLSSDEAAHMLGQEVFVCLLKSGAKLVENIDDPALALHSKKIEEMLRLADKIGVGESLSLEARKQLASLVHLFGVKRLLPFSSRFKKQITGSKEAYLEKMAFLLLSFWGMPHALLDVFDDTPEKPPALNEMRKIVSYSEAMCFNEDGTAAVIGENPAWMEYAKQA